VAEDVRRVSPDVIAAGVFGIAGAVVDALVGAAVGLFGERWVRRWGDVQCIISEDGWYIPEHAYPIGGEIPRERRLRVTFKNGKELPVTVWDMHVEFCKGGELLEEGARPLVQLVEESGNRSEFRHEILPPHIPVSLEIRVSPLGARDTDQEQAAKLQALAEADRAVFVATLYGAEDKREELDPPW
jgi:hypothetical protein